MRVSPGYAAFMDAQERREKREGTGRLSNDVYCPSCGSRMKLRKVSMVLFMDVPIIHNVDRQ